MMQSQGNPFTFQSSTVTYGGPNGAYYTSSTARRMGGNGVSYHCCELEQNIKLSQHSTYTTVLYNIARLLWRKARKPTPRLVELLIGSLMGFMTKYAQLG